MTRDLDTPPVRADGPAQTSKRDEQSSVHSRLVGWLVGYFGVEALLHIEGDDVLLSSTSTNTWTEGSDWGERPKRRPHRREKASRRSRTPGRVWVVEPLIHYSRYPRGLDEAEHLLVRNTAQSAPEPLAACGDCRGLQVLVGQRRVLVPPPSSRGLLLHSRVTSRCVSRSHSVARGVFFAFSALESCGVPFNCACRVASFGLTRRGGACGMRRAVAKFEHVRERIRMCDTRGCVCCTYAGSVMILPHWMNL